LIDLSCYAQPHNPMTSKQWSSNKTVRETSHYYILKMASQALYYSCSIGSFQGCDLQPHKIRYS